MIYKHFENLEKNIIINFENLGNFLKINFEEKK